MRLAIGDVHGRDFWKHYIEEDFSEFYFVGDYFDSFDLPFIRQYRNFRELCEKAREDGRIKLCLGNHDYHYLGKVTGQQYSGYQDKHYYEIYQILEENIDLLKIVYVTADNYIISHAGVSAWFMKRMKKNGYTAIEDINTAFAENRNILNFNGCNQFGDDITQSPIWIRPHSLEKQPMAGYSQIVGHTPVNAIKTVTLRDKTQKAVTVTYIDTHDMESIYRF
ncbi:MAG: metallophosphoesterase [Spirochaetaceae bacterium]|jgi:hypothetical protein|nr:metallophosphoesterase [Spirochaetaceae bacterium]